MIRSARAYFLSRALREKLLLVAFVGIGAIWWLSAFGSRAAAFWREQRDTTQRLAIQAKWIKDRGLIEDAAKKSAALFEPAKTFDSNQLVTTISQLATEAGLKNARTTGPTQTIQSGQFNVHSVEFTIANAEWEVLTEFYKALQKKSPYIAVERFILSAAASNEAQLTLVLKATSVEIIR